jgi:hypothetical protein
LLGDETLDVLWPGFARGRGRGKGKGRRSKEEMIHSFMVLLFVLHFIVGI